MYFPSGGRPSASGMPLGQVVLQARDFDEGIDFRRLDIGVSEQKLDRTDVHPVREEVRRERMTQSVR